MALFFDACVQAGRRRCALHEPTARLVEVRLDRIFATLKKRPLAVPPLDSDRDDRLGYGIVDYAAARQLVFRFMFSPYLGVGRASPTAAELASALAAVERGDGRPLWILQQPAQQTFRCDCSGDDEQPLTTPDDPSARAIACGEAGLYLDTVHELEAHYNRMAEGSSYADVWPNRRARCK